MKGLCDAVSNCGTCSGHHRAGHSEKLFGERYITCARYLGCYEQAFESGAVLGHAFSGRLATFALLFCDPGREQELADWMRQAAQEHFIGRGEPKNFFDLAMCYEQSRSEDVWRNAGTPEGEIERLIISFKVPIKDAFGRLQVAMTTGIGFGNLYPVQTEEMWKSAYETPGDPEKLEMLRRAGLSIEEKTQVPLPIAQQREKLMSFVKLFVATARPDLLPEFQ